MENKSTLAIVFGGNALLKRGELLEVEIQHKNIDFAAKTITQLIQHRRAVLVHGNGLQAGLLALQDSVYTHVAPHPFDILGTESQGIIGYMLQQVLKNQLPQREISVLLTQVEADANDPVFSNPTKYIGPIYNHTQTQVLQVEKGWVFKADSHSFRRAASSPQPKRIVERGATQILIAHDHLVICNGDGGVPVAEKADGYHGIEAVIDKNLSAVLPVSQIHADALSVLTDADVVYLDWGKPIQRPLVQVTPELLNEMQLDVGFMEPKVTAYAKFISQCRGIAGIGSLAGGSEIPAGDKDTLICLDTPHNHARPIFMRTSLWLLH